MFGTQGASFPLSHCCHALTGGFLKFKVDGTKTRPNLLTQILFLAHCDAPTRKEMGPKVWYPYILESCRFH
jgi:hypothetical protein